MSRSVWRMVVGSGLPVLFGMAQVQGPLAADSAGPNPGAQGGMALAFSCFARTYDAAHLKSHPGQNVRSMMMLIVNSGDVLKPRPFAIHFGVTFKTVKQPILNYGECSRAGGPEGKLDCKLECDGGRVFIDQKDKTSILVDVPPATRLTECGEKARRGTDDKLFKLERIDAKACLPLVPNDQTELKAKISNMK